MTVSSLPSVRELHSRTADGIHVRLMWSARDGDVWVAVLDSKTGAEFAVDVRDRGRSLDVFQHPFAYAAHYGIDTHGAAGAMSVSALAA
jgi:hypothetical protein